MNELLRPLAQAWPDILAAARLTIVCALVAGVLAMLLAIPAAFGRLSQVTLIRAVSSFYVETIRGTPLLLQLLVWFYGVRTLLLALFGLNIDTAVYNALTALSSNSLFPSAGVSSLFFAVIGLGFNYGAYLAEVIRAGILAVDRGQTEAAESLGLGRLQTARLIVLPQAIRLMLPALTNNFVTLVQDTAFLQILGVAELSLVVQGKAVATSNAAIRWEFYIVELLVYFVICYTLALIARRQERLGIRPVRLFPRLRTH